MQDLFAGTQSYLGLKGRLLRNLQGTLLGVFVKVLLSRAEVAEVAEEIKGA